jgi:DNA repair photolyase
MRKANENQNKEGIKQMSNMYPKTKTWNPFVGCLFDCQYCEKSFKRQLKRVSRNIDCPLCYTYKPHYHDNRLRKIPSAPNVFVAGTGDIYFCDDVFVHRIFHAIEQHKPRMKKTYFFQTKNPVWFNRYLDWFKKHQDEVVLITTLESNRTFYGISKAPNQIRRFQDFYDLDYPRKVVTIEPVLDFDIDEFHHWMIMLNNQGNLEYVWFGFDSKKSGMDHIEPSLEKSQEFINRLKLSDIEVRGKSVRGLVV